jgi:hypothetical protein
MQMSLNQMDMNVVMYPEITGALKDNLDGFLNKFKWIIPRMIWEKMDHAAQENMKMDDSAAKMDNMKMTEADYNSNALSDITTLNYAMLKSPTKTTLPKRTGKRIAF